MLWFILLTVFLSERVTNVFYFGVTLLDLSLRYFPIVLFILYVCVS